MPSKPIPLTQGSYEARSLIASAQRCVNLYPEKNPEDAVFPFSFYPVPGLVTLASPGAPANGRGLYLASNNVLFMAGGNLVYVVNPTDWSLTAIGELETSTGPVYFKDNSSDLLVADGSGKCYSTPLASLNLRPVHDVNCMGSTGVDLIDGFFLLNQPKSRNWYTSLDNEVAFDATFVAAKNGDSDLLQRVIAVQRMAWLIGERTSEIWFDAGNTDGMSFSITPGPFVQHGTPAPHSVAKFDLAVYWLAQSAQGERYVLLGESFQTKKISTPAVDWALSQYSVVSDAVAFTYSQNGHAFYVLSFPTADATWVYDITQSLWHERAWFDREGQSHRIRPLTAVNAFGKIIGVDWQNGSLYDIRDDVFTDTSWATEPFDSGPQPPAPDPVPQNTIQSLYTPTTGTETADDGIYDWDNGVAYIMMDRDDVAHDGIYLVSTLTGALLAKASRAQLQGVQAGRGPAELSAAGDSLVVANTTQVYCRVFEIDPKLLYIRNVFGIDAASGAYDPATMVEDPTSLAYVTTGEGEKYIVTGTELGGVNKVLSVLSDRIIWSWFDFTLANSDVVLTAGPQDQTKAVVYCVNTDHSGPYTDDVKIYSLTIQKGANNGLAGGDGSFIIPNPYINLALVATISPTLIDPTWTAIAEFPAVAYDATDGNLICFAHTIDVVAQQRYLFKLNVKTGVIIWSLPFPSNIENVLSRCRINYGVTAVWYTSSAGHITITAIDTILGTVLNTFTFAGIDCVQLAHDDTTGLLFGAMEYNEGDTGNQILPINGTPSSFGSLPFAGTWAVVNILGDKLVGGSQDVIGGGSGGSTPRGSFQVDGGTIPNQMVYLRSFPHIVAGGNRLMLNAFWMKLDGGNESAAQAEGEAEGTSPPVMSMRYSVDGGHTYGERIPITLGETGQFITMPTWRRLGLALGRDVVFEVSWNGSACRAVLGAWLDAQGLDT